MATVFRAIPWWLLIDLFPPVFNHCWPICCYGCGCECHGVCAPHTFVCFRRHTHTHTCSLSLSLCLSLSNDRSIDRAIERLPLTLPVLLFLFSVKQSFVRVGQKGTQSSRKKEFDKTTRCLVAEWPFPSCCAIDFDRRGSCSCRRRR